MAGEWKRALWWSAWGLLAVALAAPAGSQEAEFQWVLEQEYAFLEFHDPGYLVLQDADGERSELDFGYQGLPYEVVKTWPRDKKIQVRYSPEDGTQVVDVASGDRYPIAGAWPRIDPLLERCRSENASLRGKQSCDAGALAAWDLELNRAYQRLMKSGFAEPTKAAIRDAQRAWIRYRDAQLAALRAYVSEGGGQVRRLQVSGAAVSLTQDQAGLLLMLDAPAAVEEVTP